MPTCKFTEKNSFIYLLLGILPSFWKASEQNFFQEIQAKSSVTCNLSVQLQFF